MRDYGMAKGASAERAGKSNLYLVGRGWSETGRGMIWRIRELLSGTVGEGVT
jgi:hypothetical protein